MPADTTLLTSARQVGGTQRPREDITGRRPARESAGHIVAKKRGNDQRQLTLIAKSSKHENAKQPHWAQARSSCWGTRSPPL